MKKSLIIVLLTIVSSIECTSVAQEVNKNDKQKIVDYINCFYTAKYVLSDSAKTTEVEKQAIKEAGIDTVSIGYAYKYPKLDSILRNNNLKVTAEKLTKKLNNRNSEIIDNNNNIFDFVDKVVETSTEGIINFKFARKDECEVRNAILVWHFSQNNKNSCYKKDELESKDEIQSKEENKRYPDWGWIPLGIIILYILGKIIMVIKGRGYNGIEEDQFPSSLHPQNFSNVVPLQQEISNLKTENRRLNEALKAQGDKGEKETVIKVQNEINDGIRNEIGRYPQIGIEKPAATIIYYADIDVSSNIFVRTHKEETRISVYAINAGKQTFIPIENKQLYERLLMVNSSGILDACEVKGNYQDSKTVFITPGKVQQEENGKWRIINKAVIEIR